MYRPEKNARFSDLMTRPQRILGFIWLPIHIVILPLLLGTVLVLLLHKAPDDATANIIYYLISFAFVLIAFWRFLKEGFARFIDRFSYCCMIIVLAYFINLALSGILTALQSVIGELSAPNNDAIDVLADQSYKQVFALAVLMAPIVEEVLFRGVIFGSIARKNRVVAYAVSIILFSLYHVWQFAVLEMDVSVLLSAMLYIPLSTALTFCYDRTETIWTPIFFHIFVNTLALTYLAAT